MTNAHRTLIASIGQSILLALLSVATRAAGPDIVLADFEGTDYGNWKITGAAFGPGPARGTLPRQMHVDGFLGKGLVNSYYNGDDTIGMLTSPEFKIERPYITFLIGGGWHPGKACINLVIAGKIVRTETGPNKQPGGTERLDAAFWDISEFAGQMAHIEIVDQMTGGWGHINIDQIVLTDRKPTVAVSPQREIVYQSRYLNLPVKNNAAKRRMSVIIGDQTVREFDIELADAEPDFWVFLDISAFKGKRATIRVDKLPGTSKGLELIEQADAIKGAEDLYREKLRPQFHFSSRRGWNNDPNGMVFYKGQYHLFYQHNPYGWKWGNMHWGHAISTDLVHWQELPIAIYPYRFGDWVFSGSAVVDWKNTGGFKTGEEDVLVAAYTSTGRGEAIAFSNDRGRTWTDYPGNPVVTHKGRDPRLFWYGSGTASRSAPGHWVMAVYDEFEGKRWIAFYTSSNLKDWEFQSRTEGFFECPDIFELPVDGDKKNTRWVLTAANSEYMIGQFDGKKFTSETPKLPGHRGHGFYAAQTFSDIPVADGRRIQIGWGQMPTPGMPFNQMMCFPCELTLHTTPDGIRMFWQPVKEIEELHARKRRQERLTLNPGGALVIGPSAELFDIRAEFEPGSAEEVRFTIRGVPVVYDTKKQELVCEKRRVAMSPIDGKIRLQILVDRTSYEIFGNDGVVYMPMNLKPKEDEKSVALSTTGGVAKFSYVEVCELQSIWK